MDARRHPRNLRRKCADIVRQITCLLIPLDIPLDTVLESEIIRPKFGCFENNAYLCTRNVRVCSHRLAVETELILLL